ncbi:MAG: universal stress protein [Planctomycetota bacterium]|nr:universal stress protein [Planctomycetota bacterium]
MFSNVVIGADGSETSQDAARIARELGLLKGSKILVVGAFGEEDPIALNMVAADDADAGGLEERFRKGLETITDPLKEAGHSTTIKVAKGRPHELLIKTSKSENADLLVMGRRGHGAVKHILVGSVSSKVIEQSTKPVLIVPEEAQTETGVKTLFVPVDFSPASMKALALAKVMAKDLSAKIVLFNCVRAVYENHEERLGKAQAALKTLTDQLTAEGFKCGSRVVHGTLLDCFVQESDDVKASLIVMSSHGRSGARKVWLGSIAESILKKTSRPVLVVPARG